MNNNCIVMLIVVIVLIVFEGVSLQYHTARLSYRRFIVITGITHNQLAMYSVMRLRGLRPYFIYVL